MASVITADTLDPPSDVRCNGGVLVCDAGLISRPALTWVATPDPYATGYAIYRTATSGSGYVQIDTVSGRATTSWTDNTAGLSIASTYFYVIRSVAGSWASVSSNEVAVTILLGL